MAYLINKETYYLYENVDKLVINEHGVELEFAEQNLENIIDDSCKYFGSSYKGRIEGSKNMINSKYRVPIIVSEKNKILVFPVSGYKLNEIIWFNYFNIIKYYKEKDKLVVLFSNGIKYSFNISYTIFNNQVLKSSHLWMIFSNR